MNYQTLLLVISAIVLSHGLYLMTALSLINNSPSNRLLVLLLLLLAIRTGKSVISLLIPESDYITAIIGLVTMTAAGPILLFLIRRVFNDETGFTKKHIVHFMPIVLNVALLATRNWYWIALQYYLFTAWFLAYVIFCSFYLVTNRQVYSADDLLWRWCWLILGGAAVLGLSFSIQVIFYNPVVYVTNLSLAAVVVYGLSFYALGQARLFQNAKKKAGNLNDFKELADRVQHLFEHDEIFTSSDLNLSTLAIRLKAPPYLVSKAINQNFSCSFPEFLTSFRVKKAERLLVTKSEMLSIEGIAYECGYSSLSAFYASFKKIHKLTPAEFRNKNAGRTNMKIA